MVDISESLRRGMALHQAGNLDAAAAVYQDILDIVPACADALHLMGLIDHQRGSHEEAITKISQAIKIDPKVALYHTNLGRVLRAFGQDGEAVTAYREALVLAPDQADVHSDLAAALVALGDYAAARTRAHRALELDPSMAEAHLNLGLAYQGMDGPDAAGAEDALRAAISHDANLAGAWLGLGILMQAQGDTVAAADNYRRALDLDGGLVEAHVNLGNLARQGCEFQTAVACYRRAIHLVPDSATAHGNLGVALQETGQTEAALAAYDAALVRDAEDAEVHRNRAMLLLQIGRFAEGWSEFEWRWKTARFAGLKRANSSPRWDGRSAPRMTVLVTAEQGYGDTVQFARYLPLVRQRVGRLIVECPSPLVDLLETAEGVDLVVASGTPLPPHDAQIPLMSLPGVFTTDLDTIPSDVPYLTVPAAAVERWRGDEDAEPLPRIGIAWKGSPDHPRDRVRSPGLEPFLPLFDLSEARFISLQRDGGRDDIERLGLGSRLDDPASAFVDFADAAAVIAELDHVIACDTAMAHLAGALGKPVSILLPHVAEWRWLEDRDDSPWYPTARLFRQSALGDWAGAVAALTAELGRNTKV